MDLVSIIVPVYNVERWLPNCMSSLLGQNYSKVEIILIDDGSKDRSGQLCDEYALKDERVKVIHKPNGGVASARNLGLDHATGKYVCFVDPDDCLNSEAIETWVDVQHRTNADLVVSAIIVQEIKNGEVISNREKFVIDNEQGLMTDDMDCLLVTLSRTQLLSSLLSKLFRKDLIDKKKIRFENLVQYEDHCFVLDYLLACKKIYVTRDTFYLYRRYLSTERISLTNHFQRNNAHTFYVYQKEKAIVEQYGLEGKQFALEAERRVIYNVTSDISQMMGEPKQTRTEISSRIQEYTKDGDIAVLLQKYQNNQFDILTNAILSYVNNQSIWRFAYIKFLQFLRRMKGRCH